MERVESAGIEEAPMVSTAYYLSPGFEHRTRLGRQAPNGCALRASNPTDELGL